MTLKMLRRSPKMTQYFDQPFPRPSKIIFALLSSVNLWLRVWLRTPQTERGNARRGATKKLLSNVYVFEPVFRSAVAEQFSATRKLQNYSHRK